MKSLKLKTTLTALGFFALSATFAQIDSSKSISGSGVMNTDSSTYRTTPQGSPMVNDGTTTSLDSTSTLNSGSMNSTTTDVSSADSTTPEYKAAKKLNKAAKKEAKAEKKLQGSTMYNNSSEKIKPTEPATGTPQK